MQYNDINKDLNSIEYISNDIQSNINTGKYGQLILEEFLSNIIKYNNRPDLFIDCTYIAPDTVVISDNGIPFNLTLYPDVKTDIFTIGGKGIVLIRKLSKSIKYERINENNIVTITFSNL